MDTVDYNVEFSHIYADEDFGPEHLESIEVLKKVVAKLEKEGKNYVTTVLFDEFNPVTHTITDEEIIRNISEHVQLDFFAYESGFADVADKLLQELPAENLKLQYFHKPEKHVLFLGKEEGISLTERKQQEVKHTCALLAAAWTLSRLGVYEAPKKAVRSLQGKTFYAKKIIVILPEKYENGEKKVLEIIRSTKFKDRIKDIEHVFF